jgi:hypothetical protein
MYRRRIFSFPFYFDALAGDDGRLDLFGPGTGKRSCAPKKEYARASIKKQ